MMKLFKDLLHENNSTKFSLGRVMLVCILLPIMIYYWLYVYLFLNKDVPESLSQAFLIVMLYNLSKKAIPVFMSNKTKVSKVDGD